MVNGGAGDAVLQEAADELAAALEAAEMMHEEAGE